MLTWWGLKTKIRASNTSYNHYQLIFNHAMTTPPSFDFEKLVPGFEFLKNLGQNKATSGLSSAPSWVAPTLDPKELDKKIQELKTVQFWLDQNAKALGATIQALEVQKMTLSTLQGMNFNMKDLSESLRSNANAWMFNKSTDSDKEESVKPTKTSYSFSKDKQSEEPVPKPRSNKARSTSSSKSNPGAIDPRAWWDSLGAQFQQIAQKTVQEMQKHAVQNNELHSAKANQSTKAPLAAKKKSPIPATKSTPKAAGSRKTTPRK